MIFTTLLCFIKTNCVAGERNNVSKWRGTDWGRPPLHDTLPHQGRHRVAWKIHQGSQQARVFQVWVFVGCINKDKNVCRKFCLKIFLVNEHEKT